MQKLFVIVTVIAVLSFFVPFTRVEAVSKEEARACIEEAVRNGYPMRSDEYWKFIEECVHRTGRKIEKIEKAPKLSLEQVKLILSTSKDLSGQDLRGLSFKGLNLTGANLSKADLRGVDLRGVPLEDTILIGANLEGANLAGAANQAFGGGIGDTELRAE